MKTQNTADYVHAWLAPLSRHEFLQFDIAACKDVTLGMYLEQVPVVHFNMHIYVYMRTCT